MPVPLTLLIFALLVLFFAGVIQGATGFGSSLVAVPLLLMVFEPRVVVPVALISTSVMPLVILYDVGGHVDVGRIWPLIPAGMATMPLGMYLLLVLEGDVLRVFAGAVVAASALAFLSGMKWKVEGEKAAWVPVGAASGLLAGSTSMSGPPVILFLSNQGVSKDTFRANLTFYFLTLNVATVTVFHFGGLLVWDVVLLALALVPAVLAGTFAGVWLSHLIEETIFDRMVLVFLLILGLMALVSGLGVL